MDIRTRIGRALAGARAECDITQGEAAAIAGVARYTVCLVESGTNGSPSSWESLARVYGISVADLLLRAAALEGGEDE